MSEQTSTVNETVQLSVNAMVESLSGWDEVAIAKYYGADPSELSGMKIMRALVFVALRREGYSDQSAYTAVQDMPLGDVNKRFMTAPEDDAVGKG